MGEMKLYIIDGCPYCRKVISKLDDLDLEYTKVKVPREKTERSEVREISGQSSVPVLTDENNGIEGMNESDDIVAYLEEEYGDGTNKKHGKVGDIVYHIIDRIIEFF